MLRTSEFILNFVLNSCWQIAAIVVVAALASWLLRNGPSRYRHVLWVVALVTSLIVPLLTATHAIPPWNSTEPSAVAPGRVNSSAPQEDLNVDRIGTRRTTTVKAT